MLDHHMKRHRDMPFSDYKDQTARKAAAREALDTLDLYLTGHARAAAVKEALICLVALLGDPVKPSCRDFWRALSVDDEEYRLTVAAYALRQVEGYMRRMAALFDDA